MKELTKNFDHLLTVDRGDTFKLLSHNALNIQELQNKSLADSSLWGFCLPEGINTKGPTFRLSPKLEDETSSGVGKG